MSELLLIRRYRENRSLTQAQLANILGVVPSTVTQWESGVRKPNVLMLKKIATVLKCSTDELLATIDSEST